ncbi:MAG: membrane protein insertase YidC [Firmicutes bacterium]|nr:membrane protein insertase YidC [Bacillota bacterium]
MIQALAGYINHVLSFLYSIVGDYGVSIIMLSILVNIIMFPLTRKQLESSRKMQAIQPELKKIQEKYKHDKEKYNQATMEFMRENKVNPMGGCLPLLIQFPIMIAVFQLLRDPSLIAQTVENFNPNFLFFPLDLTQADPYYVLPVMASAATFFHQRMIMTDPKQKMMLYIFPVMILVISVNFPAGLVLYWFTNSLFNVVNQRFLIGSDDVKNEQKAADGKREKTAKKADPIQSIAGTKENGKTSQAVKNRKTEKKVKPSRKKAAPKTKKKTYKRKKKGAGKAR